MEFKDRIERIKLHVMEHKREYIIGGSCLVIGAAGMYFFRRPVINVVNTVAPQITPVFNNSIVNNGGHMRKLVKCLETGEIWETVTDAAKAAGCGVAKMSRHLNGHKPHVNNLHYEIIGLGTTG